jgi:hypothetical protein
MAADGTTSALSEMTPPPAPDPDAQTTVNDFLDYTEYFPSDLLRSLRLIGDLDSTYRDATFAVHELTKTYGKLPELPAADRPDPAVLRREIAAALEKAIYCRESTYAEASRLHEVTERHVRRLAIIKTKLHNMPQPPSRDPTPAPVSPQAVRSKNYGYDRTPRLQLHFNHGAGSYARPRDRGKKSTVLAPRAPSQPYSSAESDGESVRSTINLAPRIKLPKEKVAKPARVRPSGSGHGPSGISTSSALAKLTPPPPDAKPGSKWAPWFKLTEYEMALLRKSMKKNAVWTPSEGMIKRQLEIRHRGQEFYEAEKARCEAVGEELLDEEPYDPFVAAEAPPPLAVDAVPAPAPVATEKDEDADVTAEPVPVAIPADHPEDTAREEMIAAHRGTRSNEAREAKRSKRESQREQAMRDAQDLEDATRKIKEAAENLKNIELSFAPDNAPLSATRRTSVVKLSNKRKRDTTPLATAETPVAMTREASSASFDSGTKPPEPKRLRILPPLAPATSQLVSSPVPLPVSTPRTATPAIPSPGGNTPGPMILEPAPEEPEEPEEPKELVSEPEHEPIPTTITTIPLAPAGPSTPKSTEKQASEAESVEAIETVPSVLLSPAEKPMSPPPPIITLPAPATLIVTAASSRPRRESVAPPKALSPPPVSPQQIEITKNPTPEPETVHTSPVPASRPRSSRNHAPNPKAQSEEPKLNEAGNPTRELRRHSIMSQLVLGNPTTRMSLRKKPPPKGDITSAEDGQKTVTNVKRASGSKNKKKKKADEELTEPAEEIDPNEERYCLCDDVSYGSMIECDNHVSVHYSTYYYTALIDGSARASGSTLSVLV